MLRMLPVILTVMYLGAVVYWVIGGVVDMSLPFIDSTPTTEMTDASLLTRLEERLEAAPLIAFGAGAAICAVLLLATPVLSKAYTGRARGSSRPGQQLEPAAGANGVEDVPILPGPRPTIPEKIEYLKGLRRDLRDGDTASMKAVRLHQRMLERAGRGDYD